MSIVIIPRRPVLVTVQEGLGSWAGGSTQLTLPVTLPKLSGLSRRVANPANTCLPWLQVTNSPLPGPG